MFYTTFTEEDTCLLCVGVGTVNASEILEAKAALDLNRLKEILFAIVDLQEATDLRLTVSDLAIVDQALSKVAPNACVAVVAPRDLHFGLARMWEIFVQATKWNTHVFRTSAEACSWARRICHQRATEVSDATTFQA
jgi:hypothetical protein